MKNVPKSQLDVIKVTDPIYRITIDGEPDPLNREFVSIYDVEQWFENMQNNGHYLDYTLKIPRKDKTL